MWALGVVLFTMLYGQFPFYDVVPQELFRKIKSAEFNIPNDGRVSEDTIMIIKNLLVLNPEKRMTAIQVLSSVSRIIDNWRAMTSMSVPLQVVPDVDLTIIKTDTSPSIITTQPQVSSSNELENRLKYVQSGVHEAPQTPKSGVGRRRSSTQPPVQRVNNDAEPLTAADLDAHRLLLSQHRAGV
ncbi:hypothetical protein FSP39_005514 [Pinctada imbricata]|uniref:Protein kinase domain-containing protein n=1 Tax=Pinctada imbricata TaxID=66713 RepID=A0AA89BUY4_PINIB|nr:hypothetical protein FSP39_005514 [Pinctada imbricata]